MPNNSRLAGRKSRPTTGPLKLEPLNEVKKVAERRLLGLAESKVIRLVQLLTLTSP
jgi:hypothetical protein